MSWREEASLVLGGAVLDLTAFKWIEQVNLSWPEGKSCFGWCSLIFNSLGMDWDWASPGPLLGISWASPGPLLGLSRESAAPLSYTLTHSAVCSSHFPLTPPQDIIFVAIDDCV